MTDLLITTMTISTVMGGMLGACLYLILVERKVSARMQDRLGPNRVGPWGLLQPIADAIKMLVKEDPAPAHVDRFLYMVAPMIAVFTTLLAFAVVPFGPVDEAPGWLRLIIAPNIDIGILFIFAVTSLSVYAVILGGWASNNKYSALGAIRASAQVISYELPLGLSVLGVVLLAGTLNLERILAMQAAAGLSGWFVWQQPLAGLIFFTAALAESHRLPFDLPECEQELIGGYHTEYGGLRFVMFFLGEYVHVVTTSFLTVILFFGGWHLPWIAAPESAYAGAWLVKVGVLLAKVAAVVILVIMIRWTIPRFRYDQVMALTWKVLVPLALGNVVATMAVLEFGWSRWWLPVVSIALFLAAGAAGAGAKRMEIESRPRAAGPTWSG